MATKDEQAIKVPVIGAVERGGNLTAKAIFKEKMRGQYMQAFVRERVKTPTVNLITDGLSRHIQGVTPYRH